MDYYYYAEEEKQFGPFTVEELKSKRLRKSVLVWKEGMNDWAPGSSFEELNEFLVSEPPPLPSSKFVSLPPLPAKQIEEQMPNYPNPSVQTTQPKYDLTYTKESIATIVGILLFIIGFITLPITDISPFNKQDINDDILIFIWVGILGVRIFITFWVVNIAKRQNRDSTGWGVFAFFFPSLALIIIGQLQKLWKEPKKATEPIQNSIKSSPQEAEKITFETKTGLKLIIIDTNTTLLGRSLGLEKPNLLGLKVTSDNGGIPNGMYEIIELHNKLSIQDGIIKEIVYPKTFRSDKGELLIDQKDKNSPTIGDKVFQNGKIAKDGKYKLGFLWFIHVENGMIKRM